jgi:two-component system response regulator RegX3
LLVEDSELSRELFTDVLSADGHDVVTARDGLAGRALGSTGEWDLILLDLHLPGLPGEDVCRALRAAGIRVPIVAISASAMRAEIERAMPAGFDAYITKPVSPQELRAAVRRYAPAGATAPAA